MKLIKSILTTFALLLTVISAEGSYYAPVIINIRQAGTTHAGVASSPVIPSTNRIFRAYPGIEYNIRPAVFGGTYPLAYALSGQPSGMTINSSTGEISWPNPQSNSGTITLTVTDADARTAVTTWAITVSTSGFHFVDSTVASNGSGTLASPFKTLANAHAGVSTQTDIFYFRAGTYDLFTNDTNGDGPACAILGSTPSAHTWLGYPGETAVIHGNNNYVLTDEGYFDNLTFGAAGAGNGFNIGAIRFYGNESHVTFRRNKFVNLVGDTGTNLNQGFINCTSEPLDYGYFLTIQDNEFSDFHGGEPIGSLYARSWTVIEDNYIHDGGDSGAGIDTTEAIGAKREMFYTAIRHNKIIYPSNANWLFDLYNSYWGTNQEISYNLLAHKNSTGVAYHWWFTPYTYTHHNTIIGRVANRSITKSGAVCGNYFYTATPSGFGDNGYTQITPYVFENNVIVNPDSGTGTYTLDEVYNYSDYFGFLHATGTDGKSCVTDTNNLKNTSLTTVIDSASVTAGTYTLVNRGYVGTYGWELPGITPQHAISRGAKVTGGVVR